MLDLTTPGIFFSAISLILLAYTNRFLSLAQLVRTLHTDYHKNPSERGIILAQIQNLRRRLQLIRQMQIFGISSLFVCVATMLSIFMGQQLPAMYLFGLAMVLLLISLGLQIWEIQISVKALDLRLSDIEECEGC